MPAWSNVDEHGGAAVKDRHFAAIDLDGEIVDAEAEQRGHHMLDSRDMVAGRVAKNRAERRAADLRNQRRQFPARAALTRVMEHDPCIGVGRMEMH